MSIRIEWGHASDTTITLGRRDDRPFGGQDGIDAEHALVIDPMTGTGIILEGDARQLDDLLVRARQALADVLEETPSDALAAWHDYLATHRQIMAEVGEGAADDYEDETLLEVTHQLADALGRVAGGN